jgi:myo-inositol-1(or 4)-monophosphatase
VVQAAIGTARDLGYARLLLSHVPGEGNPGPFYERLGFTYTGAFDEDELVMAMELGPKRSPHLAFAHRLCDAAGAVILPHFRGELGVTDKGGLPADIDPVTEADRAAERAIRALIDAEHPDHGVLGEEYGKREGTGELEWVIDPIDGTRGFVAGFPLWTTLVGLRDAGGPRVGVIDQPYTGERWFGDGEGAWLRSRSGLAPLRVRPCGSLAEAVLSTTSPETFRSPFERRVLAALQAGTRLRRYGGDAYGYALVASGTVDLLVESGLQVYDWVALLPVLWGAGAVATAWDGGPAGHDGTMLVAGDARVHAEALALIERCRG